MAGFLGLDAFKWGIQKTLKENSKGYLSADMSISARRLLTPDELQISSNFFKNKVLGQVNESRYLEMFTMVVTQNESRLVQIKAIDSSYPFYGNLILKNKGPIHNNSNKEILEESKAWVYPELLTQLNLKEGDSIQIGAKSFVISDTVVEDSTQTFRLSSIAPKIYIGINSINSINLIQKGSTLSETQLFQINSDLNLENLKEELLKLYPDPAIQVRSPVDAEEDSGRVLGYLNDYLGLVSLVGFFLSMIGSTFLVRSYLNSRVYSIAVLNALGLTFRRSLALYISQLIGLALFAALLSIFVSYLILPIIKNMIGQLAQIQFQVSLTPKSILMGFMVSILGVLFASMPYLISIPRIQTKQLLQESTQIELPLKSLDFLYFIPLLLFFYLLSLFQANSFKVGSLFFISLIGSFIILYFLSLFILNILGQWKQRSYSSFSLNQAILYIIRKKSESLPTIIALSMSALLLNLIPQLKVGLLAEMQTDKNVKIPGLFLVDIQDEQVDPIQNILKSSNIDLHHISPMVRARILSVNGVPFEKKIETQTQFKTREEEVEARFRNRGFNLSYRSQLSDSEKIIEGQMFSPQYNLSESKIPEISVEKKFAERLQFRLNDLLKFDVQGVEIEGKITSFRSVKWNSFQPNFFVLFQPGVLDEAPKTWLASIVKYGSQKKEQVQDLIVKNFPNISIIDIEKLSLRILELINQMSWALQLMSLLSLMAGFFVIYSITREQNLNRSWDIYLYKVLGASFNKLYIQKLYESLFMGLIAAISGVALSIILAYGLSLYLFEGIFQPDWFWPIVSITIVTSFSVILSLFSTYNLIQKNYKTLN